MQLFIQNFQKMFADMAVFLFFCQIHEFSRIFPQICQNDRIAIVFQNCQLVPSAVKDLEPVRSFEENISPVRTFAMSAHDSPQRLTGPSVRNVYSCQSAKSRKKVNACIDDSRAVTYAAFYSGTVENQRDFLGFLIRDTLVFSSVGCRHFSMIMNTSMVFSLISGFSK